MKKYLLSCAIVFSLMQDSGAQQNKSWETLQNQGTIVYERIQNFAYAIKDPELAKRIGDQKERFELLFDAGKSLWRPVPKHIDDAPAEGATTAVRIMSSGGETISFYNFQTGKLIEQKELNAKNYIVDGDIEKLNWKLSEDTKTIHGYKVKKATTQTIKPASRMAMENGVMKTTSYMDTINTVAWYAPDVKIAAGPLGYQGQLPGLVLEVNVNNGRTIFRALSITSKVNTASIKEPKTGKKISRAEYMRAQDKASEETKKRLMENGGTIRIPSGSGTPQSLRTRDN